MQTVEECHRDASTHAPRIRWRNVYWLKREVLLTSGPAGPGRFASRFCWPSRDVAETKALESIQNLVPAAREQVTYLGADPEPSH
jgi:hypothetical protein